VAKRLDIAKLIDAEGEPATKLGRKIPVGEKSFTKGSIDVAMTEDGYMILDGQHRTAQAWKKGSKTISANILSRDEALAKYGDRWPQIEGVLSITDVKTPRVSGKIKLDTFSAAKKPAYDRKFLSKQLAMLDKKMSSYERRILSMANIRTTEQLDAWLAMAKDSKRITVAKRGIRNLTRKAEEYMRVWAKTNAEKSYRLGTSISKSTLDRAGLKLKNLPRTRLHASAVNFSIEQIGVDMNTALGSISQKLNRMFRQMHVVNLSKQKLEKTVSQEVAQRLVGGTSDADAARRMFNRLRKPLLNASGEVQLIRVIGPSGTPRNYTLRYYSQMVARTRVREAVTQGVKNTMLESGLDFVQVTAYGTDCDICAPFEDNIYSVTGSGKLNHPSFQGALTAEAEPPYHPNCTHTLVPYVPSPAEVAQDPFGTFREDAA